MPSRWKSTPRWAPARQVRDTSFGPCRWRAPRPTNPSKAPGVRRSAYSTPSGPTSWSCRGCPESVRPVATRRWSQSEEAIGGGGDDLPHVRHLDEGHENVRPVDAHPEALDTAVTGRDE